MLVFVVPAGRGTGHRQRAETGGRALPARRHHRLDQGDRRRGGAERPEEEAWPRFAEAMIEVGVLGSVILILSI